MRRIEPKPLEIIDAILAFINDAGVEVGVTVIGSVESAEEFDTNVSIDVVEGFTPPTYEQCVAKLAELQAQQETNQWYYDRANAYPSLQEQLDMMYKDQVDGTTTWADAITDVKTRYPKS